MITRRFGRLVYPFNNIFTKRGYSMGKVGFFTSRRTWINETVQVTVEGKTYSVGIVEYTDDWSPIHPAPFDKVEEDSEEDDIDGDEDEDEESETGGVSET
ncbi:unnamed protein product [Lactuca virosa]|uniref:Uncharacterized protein n=1 Tax=Lactuca virosa TaxID=75947 RepID=A0AAU9NYF2_9ASTR|nr:unnamed protein product [Lactuca virosa]